ncbi:GNAT family N-acetyltransferase [Branchiibius sp. NY16-3462-2]|uniref:GNAT family N-acetyltransferase n=1 Tax=Branchiibius sp. NY16-3462-2 TaxID=1807500 RepID=UPI0007918311|nr:GNAT family N-acetyltransferase [Branchiibius sp. NY16-3462-2]KYH45097.1 hypothetical protein AZH51_14525 [Branchiibius sp. NY16-3462-2]
MHPLLQQFHEQIRLANRESEGGPGIVHDTDGPVRRRYAVTPGSSYAMVESPEGLGDDPDHWITRTAAFFSDRDERVEWKTYSYDPPADLGERLSRNGFQAEDPEALLLGEAKALIHEAPLPDGLTMREADSAEDYTRIHDLMQMIWGPRDGDMTAELRREKAADPTSLDIVLVEEDRDGPVLCAAWCRYTPGTDFASMWGGSTLPQWRRRGIYRATVTWRAQRAVDRGYRYMRLDTSPDSRPILTRLGLQHVADTTPYVHP